MPATQTREWWSTSQVMAHLGLSKNVVLRLCEEGKFADAYRATPSSRWRVPKESVIAFHDAVKAKTKPLVRRTLHSA